VKLFLGKYLDVYNKHVKHANVLLSLHVMIMYISTEQILFLKWAHEGGGNTWGGNDDLFTIFERLTASHAFDLCKWYYL